MELLKDYNATIQYHPGKANVVANNLSQKGMSMGSLAHISGTTQLLAKETHTLESMFVQLGISERGGLLAIVEAKSIFIEKIKSKQFKDGDLDDVRINIATDKSQGTNLDANVLHNYKGRIYVQRDDDLI